MATHKQALKRHRQSLKRKAHNRATKSALSTLTKKVIKGTKEEALLLIKKAQSAIDKAGRKGIVHRRNAARKVGKLMQAFAGK